MKHPLLLSLPFLATATAISKNDTQPNVIFIYADDLGYGDLSCYGATNISTPNVDRLAKEGVRFSNAYASAATSTPSRYSLLTGEYAWRRPGTGVATGDAGMIIRPNRFTLADLFQQKGYATAAVGKWHLGLGSKTGKQDWNGKLDMELSDLGFDYSYIMAATGDRVPCVFIENGRVANYDPEHPIEVSYQKNFPGEPTGKDNPELLYNLKWSHGHNHSIVNGIGRIGYMKGGGKALWKDENIADSITSRAVRFIREQANRPFFLYFATNDIHVPRFPHDRFRGKSSMGLRGDAILQFDYSVGEILKTLDELGLRENTLIILSSDNGPILDDGYQDEATERLNGHLPTGGLRGFKYSAFEGGTRVPFIVSWPSSVPQSMVSEALFSQVDCMRSLAKLIKSDIPKGAAPDSRNYLPALLGKSKDGAPYIIQQSVDHVLSIRTPKWKLIEPTDKNWEYVRWIPTVETGNRPTPQLYQLTTDPYEWNDVANKYPAEVKKLSEILTEERNKTAQIVPSTK